MWYVDRIISVPVFTYDNYECVLSQWITEFMQHVLKVDAIIYPSVMRGLDMESDDPIRRDILKTSPREFYNVCAFRPPQFSLVPGSESVARVHQLSLVVGPEDSYRKMKAMIRALEEWPAKAAQSASAPSPSKSSRRPRGKG